MGAEPAFARPGQVGIVSCGDLLCALGGRTDLGLARSPDSERKTAALSRLAQGELRRAEWTCRKGQVLSKLFCIIVVVFIRVIQGFCQMTGRVVFMLTGVALLGFAGFLLVTQPRPGDLADVQTATADASRGQLVFAAAGCASCHMAPGAEGEAELVLAGGQRFASPFGTFIAPNISPDPAQGLGDWTQDQFARAIRDGISPAGQHYFPALPYNAYNKMTGQDVADLWAYMVTLPASDQASLPHEVGFPFNIRRSLGGWKLLFENRDWHMTDAPTPELQRGRYIVEALAHCTECHTPRNALGGLDHTRWMAGAPNPDGKGRTPNITPAKLTWSESEIFTYLTTGFTPDFDSVGGHMAHVVDNLAQLPESDVRAVVAYLRALPPAE